MSRYDNIERMIDQLLEKKLRQREQQDALDYDRDVKPLALQLSRNPTLRPKLTKIYEEMGVSVGGELKQEQLADALAAMKKVLEQSTARPIIEPQHVEPTPLPTTPLPGHQPRTPPEREPTPLPPTPTPKPVEPDEDPNCPPLRPLPYPVPAGCSPRAVEAAHYGPLSSERNAERIAEGERQIRERKRKAAQWPWNLE